MVGSQPVDRGGGERQRVDPADHLDVRQRKDVDVDVVVGVGFFTRPDLHLQGCSIFLIIFAGRPTTTV
jgi:hypothetical protein